MANITYLIGAGASANALPMVSDMKNRMQFFLNFLENDERANEIFEGSVVPKDDYILQSKAILNEAFLHATPDTYAKKLFLKGESGKEKLELLKFFLSLYFLFEQSNHGLQDFKKILIEYLPEPIDKEGEIYEQQSIYDDLISVGTSGNNFIQKILTRIDSRYDVFLSTLLKNKNNKLILPSNVNIISWNYDIQFELAYCEFDNSEKLTAIENLNVFPISKKLNPQGGGRIIKLNGMAGLFSKDDYQSFSGFDFDMYLKDPMEAIKQLLKDYVEEPKMQSFLNFAWELEGNKIAKSAVDAAKKIIADTDVLVIIGYSFPNFNKEIDKQLLERCPKLKRIYFQAHGDDIDNLCVGFQWLTSVEKGDNFAIKYSPEKIKDLKQFFIPPEFVFPPSKPQKGRGITIQDFSEFRQ